MSVVQMDVARWRALVEEALACCGETARPRGTLYDLADAAQRTKQWPVVEAPGDEYLLAALVRLARAYAFGKDRRRAALRPALLAVAGEAAILTQPGPAGEAAAIPAAAPEADELPPWTRRADIA